MANTVSVHTAKPIINESLNTVDLTAVRLKDIWSFLKRQDVLFWLVNIYLFLEYIRPQTLYPILDVIPYTKIVILLTVFLLLISKNGKYVSNIENRLLFAFSVIVLLSSIFAMSPSTSFDLLSVYISWVMVYFIIVNIINTMDRFFVFMLMFLLYNFKMSQFAFRGWAGIGFGFGKDGTGGGPGWFQNSGEFGVEMCVFFPLAAYFILALKARWPRWKFLLFMLLPLTAVTGMISSSSRGAVAGGAAIFIWMLLKSGKKVQATLLIVAVCLFAYAVMPDEQLDRFNRAGEDKTSVNRTERWTKGMQMVNSYPLLGVGYANWSIADKQLYAGNGALSHNIFVECASELGYSGLIVFILMIMYTFINNHRTRKYLKLNTETRDLAVYISHGLDGALVGYLVSGFFVTVMYYPYFWINMALTVALNNICTAKAMR